MKEENRRKYMKYLIGFVLSIGTIAAVTYARLRNSLFKEKEIVPEISMTTNNRIPPGQREVKELRVLHVGNIPRFDPSTWTFQVIGLVNKPFEITWTEFQKLPTTDCTSDFHCVTGWSKLDNGWTGVLFKTIFDVAEPTDDAHYATIMCEGGYTTSLPLKELLDDDVLFAYKLDGKELEPRFGGPLRFVVPKKYAYKSAKWVIKVKFTKKQELGYWESRGYSNTADPWKEERYSD